MEEFFLSLIRLGISKSRVARVPKQIDWDQLEDLAAKQGLSAILVDGIERLPEGQRPPKPVLLQWIGETLQSFEYRYELYCRTIAEMAAFYNEHGFKMMVLKGYACGLDWPKPEHRPCGDIDIWLFGKQEEADAALAKEKGIEIDKDRHHHTVFYWRDFMVENHFDFVNVHSLSSSRELEPILKHLGQDDSHSIEVFGEKVYLPSPDLHALFLIRHALNHFASIGISMRQVLDWALFVQRHTKEIDWAWLVGILEKYHMMDFYNCINAICVENLGFPVSIFPQVQFESNLKERVLQDILDPEYKNDMPSNIFRRVTYKYRRWRDSKWKRELCYDESGWATFFTGVFSHLMKPKSI